MHNILSRTLRSGALQIAFVGAVAVAAFGMHDGGGCEANSQTLEQLKAARQATGGFNSIIAAEAVGYSNAHITIPNMGDHWVNFDLVDTTFDPAKPEALVYNDLGTGNLQLVLFDEIGKAILIKETSAGSLIKLGVQDLAAGCYNAKITTANGVINKKVVIAK